MLPLPLSLELKIAGYALALAGVLGAVAWAAHHERQLGAASVQADWDAERLASQQAAEAQAEQQRLRAQAAASDYEAKRAEFARRAATPSPESSYALHATICPPPGPLSKPLELGDVPVPAAVLGRLRDAGADF
jgi:hypothetical protein